MSIDLLRRTDVHDRLEVACQPSFREHVDKPARRAERGELLQGSGSRYIAYREPFDARLEQGPGVLHLSIGERLREYREQVAQPVLIEANDHGAVLGSLAEPAVGPEVLVRLPKGMTERRPKV